ncbi:hypothetical protein NM688_g8259 [Phlebia brevispora]|uniref:Uncharacterized protein n=1 Tax=Phlebia brevispora TaxID=194682 RepID=A0ACC1RV93_9APHY|nr:hypothetical protein NM688_g8259 [Phlebia brevispora]
MSTRAQTLRKAAASRAQTSTSTNEVESAQSASAGSTEKENRTNGSATGAAVKQEHLQPKSKVVAGHGRPRKVYCSCKQPDDGSPMILCSECKEWYHFRCLNLDERDAEDIRLFVCPSCHDKTGLRSVSEYRLSFTVVVQFWLSPCRSLVALRVAPPVVYVRQYDVVPRIGSAAPHSCYWLRPMEWEGPEALEERKENRKSTTPGPRRRQSVTVELELRKKKPKTIEVKIKKEERETEDEKEVEMEKSSEDGSEDEYVVGKDRKGKAKARARGKVRLCSSYADRGVVD